MLGSTARTTNAREVLPGACHSQETPRHSEGRRDAQRSRARLEALLVGADIAVEVLLERL